MNDSSKQQVTQLANLLAQCLGKDWKPKVWQNIGWHYCADYKEGYLHVSPSWDGTKYYAMLSGSNYAHVGSLDWATDKMFKNPKDAVKHTLKLCKEHLDFLNNRYEDVSKSV